MNVDGLLRVLGVAAIVVTVGLLTLMIHSGDPSSSSWWLAAIPFALWIAGPAVVPYLLARKRRNQTVVITMLGFLTLSTLLSAVAYYQAMFVSTSSTSALVFLFIPLYQWTAFLVVTGIVFAATAFARRRK